MRVLNVIIAPLLATAVAAVPGQALKAADFSDRYGYDERYDGKRDYERGGSLKDDGAYAPVESYRRAPDIERYDDRYAAHEDGRYRDRHDAYARDNGYKRHRPGDRLGLRTPGIDLRLDRQKLRVRRAHDGGALTRSELVDIRDCIEDIRNTLDYAREDGIVTLRERRRLHRMLDDSARLIARLSHNRRYAGY